MLRMTKPMPSGPATVDAIHALHLDWDGGCQRYPRPAAARQAATPLDPNVLMASAPEPLRMSSSHSSTNSCASSGNTPSPPTTPYRGDMSAPQQHAPFPSPQDKRMPTLPPSAENVTFAPPPQMNRVKPPHPCEVEGHTVGRAGLLQRMGKSSKCSRCGASVNDKTRKSDGRRVQIRMLGSQDGAAQPPPPSRT